jgi:HSP20 family protein
VSDRDLFANFERMRREMDELFGDVFGSGPGGLAHRGAFSPAVDVYYVADPARAVVRAEIAGVSAPEPDEERLYQQLEIQHGPFRRVVALGADVDPDAATATYEDGMLVVEIPLARPVQAVRRVRFEGP